MEKKPTPPPVVENKPQDWNGLANNYFRQGNYVDAIECYKRVASNSPSTAVWNNMGICYQHLREYDNAIACFQKSNNIVGNGSAWYGLGKCYAEKKDRSKSIECLQKAAQMGHREAQYLLTSMNKKW